MSVMIRRKRQIKECDGCMTPGVGNIAPASTAAMTGVDQSSLNCVGSGDSYGFTAPIATKSGVRIRKKK